MATNDWPFQAIRKTNWELVTAPNLSQELEDRLADGWEPFAVSTGNRGIEFDFVYLRRQKLVSKDEIDFEFERSVTDADLGIPPSDTQDTNPEGGC